MIGKILLADSGTGQSEEMLKMLLAIPALQQASVTILHAVPPQATGEAMVSKWEEGGKVLANALRSLQLDPNRISTILRQGDPKDVVCQVAEEIETDLIIMGSRGLKRLRSILENSVSQYVFQLASRPMLLVKDDIYLKRINRVMVAMDKSKAAQRCLELALFLLRDLKGSQLILTHINPADPEATEQTDPVITAAVAQANRMGISNKAFVGRGKAGSEICRLAEDNNADLVMLGSPDRRPSIAKTLPDLDRLLGASVSDYVRVYASCPVLLIRIPGTD